MNTAISPEGIRTQTAAIHFVPFPIFTSLEMIRDTQQGYSGMSQFACFDTAFHRTMPVAATTYPLPTPTSHAMSSAPHPLQRMECPAHFVSVEKRYNWNKRTCL